jgi:rubrerythrin
MPFTITELRDLIRLLHTQPEWRAELLRVLFPEALVDLPRALEELAEAQRRTEETLNRVIERMERGFAEAAAQRAEAAADRKRIWEAMQRGFAEAAAQRAEAAADRKRIWEAMQRGFAEAAADRKRIWEAMQRGFAEAAADRKRIWEAMQQGFAEAAAERGELKGLTREWFYHYRAASIFGRLLTAGQDATEEVIRQLRAAQQAGRVSAEEYQSVLDADLLWRGKLWDTDEEVILVLEASWKVHESDVERAAQRAGVLRRIGLKALPVTAGKEWPEQVEALAIQERVVITRDGRVDDASWQAALASVP